MCEKKCKNCEKLLSHEKRKNKFCNHSCAATYTNKVRKRKEVSGKALDNIKKANQQINLKRKEKTKIKYEKNPKKCIICKKEIAFNKKRRKTCGEECYKILVKENAINNENCGGKTYYKKYKYKEIHFDSSWEVDLAKWMDNLNIKWKRKKLTLWWIDKNENKRRYHPDFYLPEYDIYLDPKNSYKLKQDKDKLKRVIEQNNIVLFYGQKCLIKEQVLNYKK